MVDRQKLPYILELLDDESPLVRQAVVRELASFGSRIYEELSTLPVEIPPKEKILLNAVLTGPRRSFLKRQWSYWFGLPDDHERLEVALTYLAEYQSGLEFHGQLKGMLDTLAEEYRSKYRINDVYSLAQFLFKDKGFTGAKDDYYNPQNSNLIYVIKQRQGIPISLSCIYILVGWRLGLNIRGCNSPRHFLTIVENGNDKELVDCFHSGKIVGEKEIAALSRESSLSIMDALKLETDAIGIIRRVLGNLIFSYQQIEREKDSFLMVHLLKEVQLYQDHLERLQSDPKEFDVEEVALYDLGQKVEHVDEGYRGIVVDYDLYCINEKNPTDEDDRPDNNQPWYKVLVHGTDRVLYVPHCQIIQDHCKEEIKNPLVSYFFIQTEEGIYVRNSMPWLE